MSQTYKIQSIPVNFWIWVLNTVKFSLPNNPAWVFSTQCCGYHLYWIMCIKLDFVNLEYDKNTHFAIKGQFLAAGKFSVIDAWQQENFSFKVR